MRRRQSSGQSHIRHNDNYEERTGRTFKPNAHGLYDLGNVAEWTQDWYEILSTDLKDHLGPSTGEYRVIRGASWMHGTITELRLSLAITALTVATMWGSE